jgi:hypothetical protein
LSSPISTSSIFFENSMSLSLARMDPIKYYYIDKTMNEASFNNTNIALLLGLFNSITLLVYTSPFEPLRYEIVFKSAIDFWNKKINKQLFIMHPLVSVS